METKSTAALAVALGMAALCLSIVQGRAALRVPAFTAYSEPVGRGARISDDGLSWSAPQTKVLWFGKLEPGEVNCSVRFAGTGDVPNLRFTVAGQTREGKARVDGTNHVVSFGRFSTTNAGYHRFELERLDQGQSPPALRLISMDLDGTATAKAHFSMVPRRNAASVHLAYPVKEHTNISAFYCEVTAMEDPVWTFYMACGWHRGYFGMQVNSPSERRIIFSVWDSGNEAVDRAKVRAEDRVALMGKGKDVFSGDFGNEGTGGHSHLKFMWKTGERQRFLVTAQPTGSTHTVYSGYYFRPDLKQWMLISSWKAPKEGGYMRGLHSFSENFVGDNGHLPRKALFGRQWLQRADGQWIEITRATFSHDATGKADRLDRFMGVERGEFFLSHGGFVDGYTRFGELFSREPGGEKPADLDIERISGNGGTARTN